MWHPEHAERMVLQKLSWEETENLNELMTPEKNEKLSQWYNSKRGPTQMESPLISPQKSQNSRKEWSREFCGSFFFLNFKYLLHWECILDLRKVRMPVCWFRSAHFLTGGCHAGPAGAASSEPGEPAESREPLHPPISQMAYEGSPPWHPQNSRLAFL